MWTRQALPSSAQSELLPANLHNSKASWNLDRNNKHIYMNIFTSTTLKLLSPSIWMIFFFFFLNIFSTPNLLSLSAWPSCLLSSCGESLDVLVECLRKECVLRVTSLVLPLAVWQVSSPLCKSNGFWEKRSGVLPTSTTREPGQANIKV